MTPIDDVASERQPTPAAVGVLPRWIGDRFRALAFWTAIVLPVLYFPLLVVGIDDAEGLIVFLGLFGLHVLTLTAGRSYPGTPR